MPNSRISRSSKGVETGGSATAGGFEFQAKLGAMFGLQLLELLGGNLSSDFRLFAAERDWVLKHVAERVGWDAPERLQ